MNNHDAVIKGTIPAHTREEKDALIKHLRAQLAEAREVITRLKKFNRELCEYLHTLTDLERLAKEGLGEK